MFLYCITHTKTRDLVFLLGLMGIYNAHGRDPDFSHRAFQRYSGGSGPRNSSAGKSSLVYNALVNKKLI